MVGVFEFDDPAVDWLEQAGLALAMAGEFMLAGMDGEVVASAFWPCSTLRGRPWIR